MYEKELKRNRFQALSGLDYRGLKHYSKELVEILGAIGFVDSYGLIEDRGIDPRESDLVMAVFMQLVEVEGYGMIRPGGKAGDGSAS